MIKKGTNAALIYRDTIITYNHLLSYIDHYTTLFEKKEEQRIAIYAENRVEWIYAFYACWLQGAVPVPIDYLSKPDEVAFIINDCTPTQVFTSKTNQDKLLQALKQVTNKPEIIVFEDTTPILNQETITDFPTMPADQTACIIYSSGTTGNPKGVMLSFENLMVNITSVTDDVPIYNSNETILAMLPFHHVFPLLGCIICPLYVGMKIAITPSLDSADIIKTLVDNKVTIMLSVPRFYTVLMKNIKAKIEQNKIILLLFKLAGLIGSLKFSRLLFKSIHKKFGGHIKYLVCGGAALDRQVEHGFFTLGFEILCGYGMTECAPMITFPRPGNVRFGACGQALSCNEIKIADDGEIITRGPNVMQGYYNLPEVTAETIVDGWLHTGDIGRFDDDGYLFITGRKKEIIVLPNGKNVNPVTCEFDIMAMSECISEVGIFLHEDLLHMVCTPDAAKVRASGISDFKSYVQNEVIIPYNEKVAPYKQIKKITVVHEALPKTRLDKLKRFQLKDLVPTAMDKSKQGEPEPQFKEYSVIRDFIRQQTEKKIFPNDHLEFDLGMDSLEKLSLQTFLKKTFDVDIHESHFSRYPTVKKLAEYIKSKSRQIKHAAVNISDIFKEKVSVSLPKSWATHILLKNIAQFFCKLYFRITITQPQPLPESSYIIAPNHQSFIDGLFIIFGLSNKQLRNTYFFAKARHVKNIFLQFMARTNNVIVVDINEDLKDSLQKLAEAIRRKKNIIIFPEGTRSYDGTLESFKKTFAILSRELNVPVVPVAIDGAYNALPRGKRLAKPGTKINVTYLDPVMPEGRNAEDIKDEVKSRIQAALDGK